MWVPAALGFVHSRRGPLFLGLPCCDMPCSIIITMGTAPPRVRRLAQSLKRDIDSHRFTSANDVTLDHPNCRALRAIDCPVFGGAASPLATTQPVSFAQWASQRGA